MTLTWFGAHPDILLTTKPHAIENFLQYMKGLFIEPASCVPTNMIKGKA